MPRRLKIDSFEMGFLELYLIYDEGGTWEPEWRALQGEEMTTLFTRVPKDTMDHALKGWTRPFITALGLSPEGCLIKLPTTARKCGTRERCSFFDKKLCFPTAKKMPWCFVPDGIEGEERIRLASEVIKFWREGVYVVLVKEGGSDA